MYVTLLEGRHVSVVICNCLFKRNATRGAARIHLIQDSLCQYANHMNK